MDDENMGERKGEEINIFGTLLWHCNIRWNITLHVQIPNGEKDCIFLWVTLLFMIF